MKKNSVEIKLRVYHCHDFDLMILALLGIINLSKIGKAAITACFLGEEYCEDINDAFGEIPTNIPSTLMAKITISDNETPGIVDWYRGFETGARNNMLKCLIRKSLSNVPVWAYRSDRWISAGKAREEDKEAAKILEEIKKNAVTAKPPEKHPAKSAARSYKSALKESPEAETEHKALKSAAIKKQDDPDLQENAITEEEFDAFDMFNSLQEGSL